MGGHRIALSLSLEVGYCDRNVCGHSPQNVAL